MVGSPQVILRRFAPLIKSASREGVGSVVLTGMLSGLSSLHTPIWKLDALTRLGARGDPALRSAKRLLGSNARPLPSSCVCSSGRSIKASYPCSSSHSLPGRKLLVSAIEKGVALIFGGRLTRRREFMALIGGAGTSEHILWISAASLTVPPSLLARVDEGGHMDAVLMWCESVVDGTKRT